MTDKERAFLLGLTRLSRETGIVIRGCGCCDSPYLTEVEHIPAEAGYAYEGIVYWISPSPENSYAWFTMRDKIVRESKP